MKPRPVTSWDDVPIIMDIPMAARIVGLCPEYLRKRAQRGTFPGYKEGNQWRITKAALMEYIQARQNTGSAV